MTVARWGVVEVAEFLVRLAGVEPAALGLEVRCSIQLSYRRVVEFSRVTARASSAEGSVMPEIMPVRARLVARDGHRHLLDDASVHHVADGRSPKVVTQAPSNAPFSRAVAYAFRKSLIRCPLSRPERCGSKYGTIRPVCRSSARTRSTWAATRALRSGGM